MLIMYSVETYYITNMNSNNKIQEILEKSGINEVLLLKLNDDQKKMLAIILMDNHNASNKLKTALLVVSLEVQGKVGSIYLLAHHIATVQQLKNLTKFEIRKLVEEHDATQDDTQVSELMKEMLVNAQQKKIYSRSEETDRRIYIEKD